VQVDGLLAIGLSDNSVALWDLSKRVLVTRVKSPEKCLLYSMRMWGDSVRELVASGAILNEVSFPGSWMFLFSLRFKCSRKILNNFQIIRMGKFAFHYK